MYLKTSKIWNFKSSWTSVFDWFSSLNPQFDGKESEQIVCMHMLIWLITHTEGPCGEIVLLKQILEPHHIEFKVMWS